jgi:hypothetical protein
MKTGAAATEPGSGNYQNRTICTIAAVMYYPLAVVDRMISIGKVCVASQLVHQVGIVLNETLYTIRHTATAATDVAEQAGEVVRYGVIFQAAARLTTMLASTSKYVPFMLM